MIIINLIKINSKDQMSIKVTQTIYIIYILSTRKFIYYDIYAITLQTIIKFNIPNNLILNKLCKLYFIIN